MTGGRLSFWLTAAGLLLLCSNALGNEVTKAEEGGQAWQTRKLLNYVPVKKSLPTIDKTSLLKDVKAALPYIDLKKKKAPGQPGLPGLGLSFGPPGVPGQPSVPIPPVVPATPVPPVVPLTPPVTPVAISGVGK